MYNNHRGCYRDISINYHFAMRLEERKSNKEFRQTIFDAVREYARSECNSIPLKSLGTFETLIKYNSF